MKYVYCLTRAVPPWQIFPPGITGARVGRISFRGLTALTSDVAAGSLVGTAEQATAHGEIVNRAWQIGGSVIPCRFGTMFANRADVVSLLEEHYASFEACLSRLADRVELGVKAIFDKGPVVASSSGIEGKELGDGETYLVEKRKQLEKAEQFSQAVREATASLWQEMKAEKQRTAEGLVLSYIYLLDRDKLSAFNLAYQRLRGKWPGLKILYSGPWPPYTFARVDLVSSR